MVSCAVNKILILNQGGPVTDQLLGKALSLVDKDNYEIISVKVHKTQSHAIEAIERVIRNEKPQLVLIGATALGEEVAPALGVRLRTGVAAHCIDIKINDEGDTIFFVPAFGGKVIGEIFIPKASGEIPAIATVKPGMFSEFKGKVSNYKIIDIDGEIEENCISDEEKIKNNFKMIGIKKKEQAGEDISKTKLILCGGFGLGKDNYKKLEFLAGKLGGAVGCTRAALDAGWGFQEGAMIGTSGISVRPKVYIGFGVSGASHHVCGIKDADIIININNDKNAEVFATSDYKGIFDAGQLIDALKQEIEREKEDKQ